LGSFRNFCCASSLLSLRRLALNDVGTDIFPFISVQDERRTEAAV